MDNVNIKRRSEFQKSIVAKSNRSSHFFASSAGAWLVDTDLKSIIRRMDRDHLPYSIWYVPTDISAEYEISYYRPQVDGALLIATLYPSREEKA